MPASTGFDLGEPARRWDAFLQQLDVSSTVISNLIPDNNARNLGSASARWNVFLQDAIAGNLNSMRVVHADGEFPTVQAAIDDIPAASGVGESAPGTGGGLVVVSPGTYPESITLKSGIRVVGYGPATRIAATGAGVTIVGTGTDSGLHAWLGLENVTLDASAANVTALELNNCAQSSFRNIWIVDGAGSGTGLRLKTTSNGNAADTSDNTVHNDFHNIWIASFATGISMEGDFNSGTNVGGVGALNFFYNTQIFGAVTGVQIDDWFDSQYFYGLKIALKGSGASWGIRLNTLSTTSDVAADKEYFDGVVIEGGSASSTAVTMTYTQENIFRNVFIASPISSSGTILSTTADTGSYIFEQASKSIPGIRVKNNNYRFDHLDIEGSSATTPATTGAFRLPNSASDARGFINARNAADSLDINLLGLNGSDVVLVGQTTNIVQLRGQVRVETGIADSGGYKHTRIASGTTGGSLHDTASATWTFGADFPDTNYNVVVTIDNPTGVPIVAYTENKAVGSIDIVIMAGSAAAASGTLNCTAVHD